MTDLNDKKKRQDLMLRYLNAETTIEEEQFLQNCLEHSEEQLTPEEGDLLLIISSTRHVGDVEPSDDKEAEFDKMIAGETLVGKNHKTAFRLIWPSSMLIAVMLALFLMTKGSKHDAPVSPQYATTTPAASALQASLEDTVQQREGDAAIQIAMNEDGDSTLQPALLAYGNTEQDTDIPVKEESHPGAAEAETSEAEIHHPAVSVVTSITEDEPEAGYPQNVTAANYNAGRQGTTHFPSSGNVTIFTQTTPHGNTSHFTIVNTRNGMEMLYPEAKDDSVIYIVDGMRVTKETATRIPPDSIKQMRRLKRGTADAVRHTPEGLHHDILLITTKRSDSNRQDHSLAPYRNIPSVTDDNTQNGICLL